MERAVKAGKPFFIWHNTTRMHVWTHLSPKYQDLTGHVCTPTACSSSTISSVRC